MFELGSLELFSLLFVHLTRDVGCCVTVQPRDHITPCCGHSADRLIGGLKSDDLFETGLQIGFGNDLEYL